jgi:hypothetical protein
MAARFVLRDYVNGKLLFCHIRPDYDRAIHGDIVQSGFKTHTTVSIPEEVEENKEGVDNQDHEDDDEDEDDDEENEEVKELEQSQSIAGQTAANTTLLTTSSKVKAETMAEAELDREFFVL